MTKERFRMLSACFLLFVFLFSLISDCAAAEHTAWVCPGCGRAGNTGNYCGSCRHPAPWIVSEQSSLSDTVEAGDFVTFGHYEQDNNIQDGQESIEWIVLDKKDKECLLLSRYGLEAKLYNDLFTDVTWETCTLRKWLNGDFLKAAFTDRERSAILLTEVDNSPAQGYDGWNTKSGAKTEDKVFLLSCTEANRYLGVAADDGSNMKSRVAPTPYAFANWAWMSKSSIIYDRTEDGEPSVFWWLRSPGEYSYIAACVYNNGSFSGYIVGGIKGIVRPALWLDLDSVSADEITVSHQAAANYSVAEILKNGRDEKNGADSDPYGNLNVTKVRFFIANTYRTALGRPAGSNEIDNCITVVKDGIMEIKLKEVVHNILFSEEIKIRNLNDEEFIRILYLVYLQREPEKAGLEQWVEQLEKGALRETVADGFADSPEFKKVLEMMSE